MAQIILLLISSDFLASDYCYSIEMKRALERHDLGESRVIPILIRPVVWEEAPFAKLQVLPRNAKPVTTWANQDLAFVDIAMQIRRVASDLTAFHMKRSTNSPGAQKLLKSTKAEMRATIEESYEKLQQEHLFLPDSQTIKQFRLCQKKVEELKSVHNMLHEIEVQLTGLTATIQLLVQDVRDKKKSLFRKSFSKSDNRSSLLALSYVEITWRQTALKIDDLEYFAAETMEVLEDERFYFEADAVKGPSWVTELFFIRQSFEVSLKGQDSNAIRTLSAELLTKCRAHLYRIDKRLLDVVRELDFSSNRIIGDRT